MHAVINEMKEEIKTKESITKAEVEKLSNKLLEADKFLIEKLYIVQLASVEGWKFANQVKFNLSGKKKKKKFFFETN